MFPERIRQQDDQVSALFECRYNFFFRDDYYFTFSPKVFGSKKVILDNIPRKYKPGVLSLNPVDIRKHEATVTNDTVRWVGNALNPTRYQVDSGCPAAIHFFPDNSLVFPVDTPALLADLASAKAYAKVMEPDVGLLENLAEAGQTLQMFINPMKGLVNFAKKMHKAALKQPYGPSKSKKMSPSRYAKGFSDAWLQYRYGIMPLILSVEGLKKSYLRHFSVRTPFERKSGSISSRTDTVGGDERIIGNTSFKFRETKQTDIVTRTEYFYRSEDGLSKDLWSVGAHPYQYLGLAWDLLPASFMVDWSLGIGDWLKAIMPAPHITFLTGFTSWRNTKVHTRYCLWSESQYKPSMVGGRINNAMATATVSRYYRSIGLPVLGPPKLSVDMLSLARRVDTLTILAQQLLRRR